MKRPNVIYEEKGILAAKYHHPKSLDQTPTSGVSLEALEKPQNPCAGIIERGISRNFAITTGFARKGPVANEQSQEG